MTTQFKFKRLAVIVAALALSTVTIQAQKGDQKEVRKAEDKVSEASAVLRDMMQKPDSFIPHDLLEKAQAVAIFPGVVKGAFIIGGRGGDGIVVRREGRGWSLPLFYNIGGASFGPQIGVKKTDYIMLFMNDGAVRHLLNDKVELGGDVSFAAGPVGRTAGADTDASLHAGILTWSRSEGAFVGASIKGAVITPDNDRNLAVYGVKADQLLNGRDNTARSGVPADIQDFSKMIGTYAGLR